MKSHIQKAQISPKPSDLAFLSLLGISVGLEPSRRQPVQFGGAVAGVFFLDVTYF